MIFGVHTGVQNTSTDELRALWRRIEGHGFEWISIWDHFYAADVTDTRGAVGLRVPRGGRPPTPRSR